MAAAAVELTGADEARTQAEQIPVAGGAGPAPQADAGIAGLLAQSHGDPAAIAAQLVATHRTEDARVWTELQQSLGNAQTTKVREAIAAAQTSTAAPAAEAAPATAKNDALPAQVDREVLGVTVTAPAGVRAAALDECIAIVQQEIGNNEFAQKKFHDEKVSIVIIPAHEQLTALPVFAHLKGKQTFDGRDWSTVRGMGGTKTPNGRFSIAVAEEGMAATDVKSQYPATYSVAMHELAHVLESKGMSHGDRNRIKQLYAAHIAKDPGDVADTFTDHYGSENEEEYFAQSTNAFFDRNVMDKNHSGRAWLQANDPDMYAFLVDLYDKHHDKDGKVA